MKRSRDDPILNEFLEHSGLESCTDPEMLLPCIAEAFSKIPYENLTKIIKDREFHHTSRARREPAEVIANHFLMGTGGTCFSLTAALLHILRSLGWQAEPIMADRRYGADTHCALLVWLEGRPHLLDPGFLLTDPIPLESAAGQQIDTAFNRVILAPREGGNKIDLCTRTLQGKTLRLTYKTSPVDEGEFRRLWEASFDWDMMRYPLLTRVCGTKQIYLRDNYLQIRDADSVQKFRIPPKQLADCIAHEFNMSRAVVVHALASLKAKGESIGQASTR